ncbi:MAG TPA: glycosyltransferase family 1 protein [Acidobacteriota bacterium]|nr:glycosyltransferase family 1 protein [Acidobacteriota bacterium]
MRLVFDARPAFRKNSRRRGIGKYVQELVRALLRLADPQLEIIFYGCGKDELSLPPGQYYYRSLFQLPKPSRLSWVPDRFLLPRQLAEDAPDVFHVNEITSIVFRPGVRTVVTLHDLIPLIFREQMKQSIPWDYAFALKQAFKKVRQAATVVTDSLHSKSDICHHLAVDPNKVVVVYPGCDSQFVPRDRESARSRIASAFKIHRPFLFYVGGTDYRKNLPLLIDGFARIRRGGYEGLLVLAGETFHWDIDEVRQLRNKIAKQGIEGEVIFPGFVGTDQLIDFYSCCDMFVFPSLYEGFGLPVLEALSCGSVVLTTKVASIPEVAGDAAVYFDPSDSCSLVDEFFKLHGNQARKDELRAKGPERAKLFTWDNAARRLLTIYASLVS